ncbi:uncharacterized protein [Periplaneta americana]|uniref:uncharacterized protein n=1 Tax=Periplaneta americana TaxID=6978 RepID=UPI0037E9A89C
MDTKSTNDSAKNVARGGLCSVGQRVKALGPRPGCALPSSRRSSSAWRFLERGLPIDADDIDCCLSLKMLMSLRMSLAVMCLLVLGVYGNVTKTSDSSTSTMELVDDASNERTFTTEGIWSPILEELALTAITRDQKVMKHPYVVSRPGEKPSRPTDSSGGGGKEVTETDLYLLGAIEKLVYRVDFMEKRLRRTEELLYHLMANSNKNQEPCPANFSRVGAFCYHFSERELNWKSSSSMCRALGSRLAELETVEENQDIVAYLQSTAGVRGKDFWTGGLNPGLLWIWSNSARPVASNSTENPTSNNIKGNGRCLKLAYNPTVRGYEYQGSECSVRARYICEYDENSTSRALERIQKSLQEQSTVSINKSSS